MGMKEGPWLATAKTKGLASSSVGVKTAALSGGIGRVTLSSDALAALSEAQWQEMVATVASDHGWKVAHCRKVKVKRGKREWWETTMPAGWFDLVLVRGSILYVELKVRPNVRTPEQTEWANAVVEAGGRYRLWYPEQLAEVQEMLL